MVEDEVLPLLQGVDPELVATEITMKTEQP